MADKIYLLKNKKTGEEELISAPNAYRATSFALQSTYEDAKVAPQADLVRLITAGVKVQEAKEGGE
jgi:hypothetical protein